MGLLKRLKEYFGFIEYHINEHYVPATEYQKNFYLPVEIIKGPYGGVVFSFENVNWNRVVDGSGERMVASYNINIIEGRVNKKFRNVADDIWADYAAFIAENHNKVKEQVLKDDTEEYPDEEYRTDHIEEFVTPRGIRSKGTALPTSRIRTRQKRTTTSGGNQGLHSKLQPPANKDSD